jgi:hypothetical protein
VTNFEFATAGRIVFGRGTLAQLAGIAATYGKRPLIVTGKRTAVTGGLVGPVFSIAGEPSVEAVREGAEVVRRAGCDLVVAIGGGSALDAGKAIAAAAANGGDLLDYLEVIGSGKPLECAPWPFIAVPTTAGTGSEVTRNAVLGSAEHGVKVSLRSPAMLARVAIVDPELTLGLPPAITATTECDARPQAFCARTRTAATWKRAAECRGSACLAGSHSPMRALESCMVSPRPSAGCSTRRTAPSARRCWPPEWRRTSRRCANASRGAGQSIATGRLRASSREMWAQWRKMVRNGCGS